MRLVFKSVLLAVAALALSGVTAAAASAETHEWLLNGSPVEKSTPVTDSAEEFTIKRNEPAEREPPEEIYKCTVGGKGTVSAKGAGSITAWSLTSCKRSGTGGYPCEAGTLSGPTALNLPWTTQLRPTEGIGAKVVNEVQAGNGKGVAFTWQCKVKYFFESRLYQVTCFTGREENTLEHELGQVREIWQRLITLKCERSFGSEKLAETFADLSGANHIKAEKGELSFK